MDHNEEGGRQPCVACFARSSILVIRADVEPCHPPTQRGDRDVEPVLLDQLLVRQRGSEVRVVPPDELQRVGTLVLVR